MKTLVVLDFDGTIYKGDSMLDFAWFLSKWRYLLSLFIIVFPYFLSLIGIMKRDTLKKLFLYINFRNYSKEELRAHGKEFANKYSSKIFNSFLDYYSENSMHDYLIISGSCEEWLMPFSKQFNAKLICTQLSFNSDGISMGTYEGNNVIGKEKVRLFQKQVDASKYNHIVAFGDSKHDQHLDKISHDFHLNYFKES